VGPDGALWFTEEGSDKIGRITAAGTVTEYAIPTASSAPYGIAAGPDGAIWFTEYGTNKIGRAVPGLTITESSVPTSGSEPYDVTSGPDGALWFTEIGSGKIGRITIAGTFNEYTIPTASAEPWGITAGPDGALWFAEYAGNKIGRITTAGSFTEYRIPTATSFPVGIAAGPDGALWFTEGVSSKIGRITTAGAFTEYPTPTASSRPVAIAAGPDGALWFAELIGDKIGRITTTGTITEYAIPTASSEPVGITSGPDGALWFTEYRGNNLGRITTAGIFNEFSTPSADSQPYYITTGPDGALWFAESNVNKIGHAIVPLARPSVEPASGGGLTQTLTFRFTDAAGPSDIGVADVLINNALDGQHACYLAYVTSSNTLYLVDNNGDAEGPFAGSLVLDGGGGSIQNSQCQIHSAGSAATSTATTLVLTLNVTFEAAFAGNQIVHLATQSSETDYSSGWQRVGVWEVPGSPAAQITMSGQNPARGVATGGIDQTFTFTITDTSGYTNLGVVNVLINESIDGIGACYLAYSESSNTLFLVDNGGDAGGPYAGSMVLNGSGSIQNSQCQIEGAGSSATGSGDTLTLLLNVFFFEGFVGNQAIYSAARDSGGNHNTGWQTLGTWSVQ
jgi:streptogramin lyase